MGEVVAGEIVSAESVNSAEAALFTAIFEEFFKDNAIFGERFFVRIEKVFRLLPHPNSPESSTRSSASRARALPVSLA